MKLNERQRLAVYNLLGNSLITASPGSGKTRTLVARAIHKLDKVPKHRSIALITYTNAAADEIASRLVSDKPAFIGTIHSFCLEYILRPFGWIYNWSKPKIISFEQQENFFEENLDIRLEENFGQNKFDELGKIGKKLDGEVDCSIEWNHTTPIQEAAQRYYDYQNEHNVIDFNEILYRSYHIVKNNDFVSKSLSSKFYEILIDEFQDTNLYQYEIMKLINHSGDCTFFMVGDSKQRIFSFAGAIEDSFTKALCDFNAESIDLNETYRSTDNIVRAYSSLFNDHPVIKNRSIYSHENIKVAFIQTEKANHQRKVSDIINILVNKANIKLNEVAILSTSWFSAYPLSKSIRQQYNIVGLGALPHKSINNSTMSLFRALSKYYVDPSIRKLRSIKRNIDLHLLDNDLQYSDKEVYIKTNFLISNFLTIDSDKGLTIGIKKIERIFCAVFKISHSTFDEVLEKMTEEEKESWSIGQYIKTLAGVDGINCNTIHKVKGLEFDAVILNEMNENKIPYQKLLCRKTWTYEDLTEDDINNGRNLFYVAISRARKYLIILHNWKPSMFIEIVKEGET